LYLLCGGFINITKYCLEKLRRSSIQKARLWWDDQRLASVKSRRVFKCQGS